jgi:hypothetical protein
MSNCHIYRRHLNRRISVENGRPVAVFFLFYSPEDRLSLMLCFIHQLLYSCWEKFKNKNPNFYTSTMRKTHTIIGGNSKFTEIDFEKTPVLEVNF